MAIGTVVWSIRSQQFEDQNRARYLPLVGLTPEELADKPPVRTGVNFYAMLFIIFIGLFSIGSTLYVMYRIF